MRWWSVVFAAAGCTEEGATPADGSDDDDTTTGPPLPATDTTDTDTGVPPPPPPDCDPLEGLEVVSLTATAGDPDTLVELHVTLSEPATVAAACVADAEPDQIFFAESTVTGTEHHVRLSGLFPNASYTCRAAPTCPTQLGPAAVTTWQTSVPPSVLRPATMTIDPVLGMTGAWTLAPFALALLDTDAYLAIWGPDGRVRWWMHLAPGLRMSVEARYHVEDDKIVWGGGYGPEGRPHVVDLWDGEQYAWAPEGWEEETFHHDGKRISDGRLMTLEIRAGNTLGLGDAWQGFGIRIVDPVTEIVDFDFNSQTLVTQGILAPPDIIVDDDPYHANWMDWYDTAEGPRVYVSLCYAQQILSLDAVTGELDWLLGEGLGWSVLDEAGLPLPADALPDCQHGLEVLGDDRLLVYDNGMDEGPSHAQEWLVDEDTMTAQRVWDWSEFGWTQWILGDIDDLGNNRVLITKAPEAIIEVDRATGIVASKMAFPDGGDTYRAERYDGCTFFTSVKECAALAQRYAQVASLLE